MKQYYVYILSNKPKGTLYTGVTSDLIKRVWQHKSSLVDGFTKKYDIKNLVYYQIHEDIVQAINYEKKIKSWKRDWKIQLIEKENPNWLDLYADVIGATN